MYSFRNYSLLFLILIFSFGLKLNAQDDEAENSYSILMISRASKDSIMLRWAPANYESWQLGNKNGYVVERYTILKDNKPFPDRRPLTLNARPIKPISVDEWEIMSEYDDYAGVAAQAIYGEGFEIDAIGGSSVISVFNRGTEQQNRYSFAMFAADYSADVARGMGLMFTDKNVTAGEKYLYVVYFATAGTLKIDTAYTFIGTDEIIPLNKPLITQTVGENKLATLEWLSSAGRQGYTSFEIQRSDNGGLNFATRNTSPLINTTENGELSEFNFYIDTLPVNNKNFVYRVRGINPFGEKGPYSDTVSVAGKEKINDRPYIVKHEALEKSVFLEWEFTANAEKNIKGFQIMRSGKSEQGFLPVSGFLSAEERTFTDADPIPTAYYKVHALGKNNELAPSFPVLVQSIDSIPPVAPVRLHATVDTTGKVFLKWKANTETDIYGYRIYRANSKDDEFSQITISPVSDTFYLDKIQLKTLSRKVYYRVMAIDKRQNHSEFSEILEVTRPDIVPPVPPVIKNIYSSEKGVCIEWIHSSSTDVISQAIFRKPEGSEAWQELYIISDTITTYCDSTTETGTIYNYTLAAYDETGLKSNTEQVVSGKKQYTRQAIELNYKINRNGNNIELSWKPVEADGKYILYRAAGKDQLMTYASFSSSNSSFTDKKVTPDTQYRYVLKCMINGQIYLSNEVDIQF